MEAVVEFFSSNAALLVAVVALVVSLRASHIAHQAHGLNLRNKADADRVLLFEKKRELLNEVDRQHTVLATLGFLTEQQIVVFQGCPKLDEILPDELDRLKNNVECFKNLEAGYEEQRRKIELIDVGADISAQEEMLASIQRLTIHLEKDIAHERSLLESLRRLASTAPDDSVSRRSLHPSNASQSGST